ncbi:hypothetical protein VP1G_03001 [Cytospora mali]|uniref:Uncharacterized protein n=1 Tax=Cytospora mali TaxID=578113 RepID=A0A194UVF5_CYTMA|nr:hypothetical protein VP1G_03001 [Valsa mali var. pyri (nom. inval.)]
MSLLGLPPHREPAGLRKSEGIFVSLRLSLSSNNCASGAEARTVNLPYQRGSAQALKYLSSIILVLATATNMIMAIPAPTPAAEATSTSVELDARATVAATVAAVPAFKPRQATVAMFSAACTVGTDTSATCTGAIETTNAWEGVLAATVAAATVA